MSVITPFIQPAEIERLQQAYIRSLYEVWRSEYEAKQPKFIIENIRFHHDPNWRDKNFFGPTYILSGGSYFWIVVRWTFTAAQFAPYIIRMF